MAKHPEVGTLEYKCDVAAGALQLLLEAVHRDDPKREILVRIGDLMRDVEVVTKGVRRSSEPTSAWQPIETAPRDGRRLLGTGGGLDDTVEVISYNGRVGAWDTENYTLDDRDDEAEGYNRPSHWQPMPSAHVSSSGEES